jgi:hypothetical protein
VFLKLKKHGVTSRLSSCFGLKFPIFLYVRVLFFFYDDSKMWYIFLILYVSYLILGPHWESKLIEKKPVLLVDSVKELFRRSIFISYVSLLYAAWFLYSPSYATAVNALLLSGGATYGFYTKYGPEKPVPMHIILNIFLLVMSMKYLDFQTVLTVCLLVFYHLTRNALYLPA